MLKPIFRIMIALSLALLFCGPVGAAQHTGPYVGAFFGGNIMPDSSASDSVGNFNLSFNPGLQGSVAVGWDLAENNPLGKGRVELEYARRSNSLDRVEFVEGKVTGNGDLKADSLLLNFIGVIRSGSRWSPYILIGVGAARIDASDLKVAGQPLSTDTATTFAYQVGCGIDYALTDSLSLDLGYRFFGTPPPKFTEANGDKFTTDYLSHSIILGLRVGF
jgi:opacity protein-like surface antigen